MTEQMCTPSPPAQVAVIGDVMLDENMHLSYTDKVYPLADRASLNAITTNLGGAGNVAVNAACLGNPTALVGMVGEDVSGAKLFNLARSRVNLSQMFFVCDQYMTPRKLRLYDRHCLRTLIDDDGKPKSYYHSKRAAMPFKPTPLEVCTWLVNRGVKVFCTVDHGKGFLWDGGSADWPASQFQNSLRAFDLPIIVDPRPNANWPYIAGNKVILKMNHEQLNLVAGPHVGRKWEISGDYVSPSEARAHFNEVRYDINRTKAIKCDWLWLTYGKGGMSIGPMEGDWSVFVGGYQGEPVDIENIKLDATGCGDTCTAVMANAIANRGYSTEVILEGFLQANHAAGLASKHLGCHVLSSKLFKEVSDEVSASEDFGRVMAHV